ncbi:MAG: TIGR01777 family oxidoreductase [Chthoniobacterales bacterium]
MRIGIVGISGFIGNILACAAHDAGHTVVGFSRRTTPQERGDFEMRHFDPAIPLPLQDLDAVVNLAGESIFSRWTPAKRKRILDSRVNSTRHIVNSLALHGNVRALVNISAIGFYGERGDTVLDEASSPGTGFLAEVTQAWEAEAVRAAEHGVRVVLPRLGMVLGKHGGANALLKPVFRCGLGGKLGSGRQWMSCIHVEDVAGIVLFALGKENLSGPINTVTETPLRNSDFTRVAAHAAHRPAFFAVPAFVLKLALGSMSRMILDSQRVLPARAMEEGYPYRFTTLESAVKNVFE